MWYRRSCFSSWSFESAVLHKQHGRRDGRGGYNNPAVVGYFRPFISVWWHENVFSTYARQAVFLLWLFGALGGGYVGGTI